MLTLHSRKWRPPLIGAGLMLALTFGSASNSSADRVLGGGPATSDCYNEFEVTGGTVSGKKKVTAGQVNGTCTFTVALCPNQTEPGCTPHPPLTSLKAKGLTPPTDLNGTACGPTTTVTLKKNHAKTFHVMAKSSGTPKKDVDTLILKCTKKAGTTTTTVPISCTNPNGGPDQIDLTVADTGTDLDNGWTGISHNFPVDARSTIHVCLSGCDASTNPMCDLMGPLGAGSINGATFGPPLPLIAQGVAVCVINRYQPTPVTGKYNVQTGEVSDATPMQVNLFSDVHLVSDHTNVCPRCGSGAPQYGASGTCTAGAKQGQPCKVESIVSVVQSQGNPNYGLSADCPPNPGEKVATLDIKLPLTTGTSTLPGPKPCGESQDDNCRGSACTPGSCTGTACATKDAAGNCVDSKGGISQACCAGSTTTPCFPTAGGGSIQRTGHPDPPTPAWPDTTYPKTSTNGILATTFCEAATGVGTIDVTTGLPGPGALLLPGKQVLLKK